MSKHPIQPIEIVNDVARFKENKIIRWMLEHLTVDGRRAHLNEISMMFKTHGNDQDDYQQLMQLMGYSVDGYADLSTHDPNVLERADKEIQELTK